MGSEIIVINGPRCYSFNPRAVAINDPFNLIDCLDWVVKYSYILFLLFSIDFFFNNLLTLSLLTGHMCPDRSLDSSHVINIYIQNDIKCPITFQHL